MLTIEKEFRFEAAHRLVKGFRGKCANIHGHSWVCRVEVTKAGDQLDEYDMILDFGELKKVVAPVIEALDHSCIVYEHDDLLSYLIVHGQKAFVLPDNPTSEALAKFLFNEFTERLNKIGVQVISVTIDETCTSRCKYTTNY